MSKRETLQSLRSILEKRAPLCCKYLHESSPFSGFPILCNTTTRIINALCAHNTLGSEPLAFGDVITNLKTLGVLTGRTLAGIEREQAEIVEEINGMDKQAGGISFGVSTLEDFLTKTAPVQSHQREEVSPRIDRFRNILLSIVERALAEG